MYETTRETMSFSLLLVEDDAELLDIFARRFERRGYRVISCANVDLLSEIAAAQPIDVAVMDRTLGERDSLQLIFGLREIHPLLRVIVLSGRSDRDSVEEAKTLGADEYLFKPCSFTDLEAAVVRACPLLPK